MCKNTKSLLLFVLCCLLWLAAGTASQAETMYQISESELTQLETNLQTLKRHNETKQQLSIEQKQLLTEANQQLETVKKELIASKNLNDQTQKSLEKANQSLTELEKEAAHKVQVKARQRNLWIIIAGGALYACISK